MKHLIKAKDIRHLVFGSPSIQLGDNTISINEVSKAIFENDEIKQLLTEKQYKKVCLQVPNAKADYANYGCYGTEGNETFYAIEFYKFETYDKNNDFLFIIVAKPFTCEFCGGEESDDVIVDYNGQIESDYFFGSYTAFISKNVVMVNGKMIKLIKNIPIGTEPEEFYALYMKGKQNVQLEYHV